MFGSMAVHTPVFAYYFSTEIVLGIWKKKENYSFLPAATTGGLMATSCA